MFKKRPGTTAVHGQFYESKLLSLILFRALNDENIEDFYLASNVDDIEAFDDVCLKMKIKGLSKPLLVFIQAKHKENSDKFLTLNSKSDLVKYFHSYLTIRQKFDPNIEDKIFNEQFENTECLFIMYTNERGDANNSLFANAFANHLNGLIATGKVGSKPIYSDEEVQYLSKINTVTKLAKHFVKFLYIKNNQSMMNDEYILLYHVVLAQNVVDLTEVQEQYRTCTFRPDFFSDTDEFFAMFRDELYREVLKTQKLKKLHKSYLHQFLSAPSEDTLSQVIGNVLVYKNGKLELTIDMPVFIREKLDQINLPQSTVNEAIRLGAMNVLKESKFIVPAAFGNSDIKIRGKPEDIEKRLNYLTASIVELVEKAKPSNVVIIDESVNEGLLRLNGGLGSAVGNLLVYDDNTKLIKFTDNDKSLRSNARCLLQKLKNQINNLHEYRFDVKNKKLPKLSLDGADEHLARDFLSKLVFYTQQGDHNYVEWILKQEIEYHQDYNRAMYPSNIPITSDAIFLKYHDLIQKWWMPPKEVSAIPYLTKSSDIYQQAVNNIVTSSYQTSVESATCIREIENSERDPLLNTYGDSMQCRQMLLSENLCRNLIRITILISVLSIPIVAFYYVTKPFTL